jgi:hypothetical protein
VNEHVEGNGLWNGLGLGVSDVQEIFHSLGVEANGRDVIQAVDGVRDCFAGSLLEHVVEVGRHDPHLARGDEEVHLIGRSIVAGRIGKLVCLSGSSCGGISEIPLDLCKLDERVAIGVDRNELGSGGHRRGVLLENPGAEEQALIVVCNERLLLFAKAASARMTFFNLPP